MKADFNTKIRNTIERFLNENARFITSCNREEKNSVDNDYSCKIYNEFSLQHELGLYLRNDKEFENSIILFEKNVKSFADDFASWVKHEIDIVIVNKITNDKYPEQMFQFIKDIQFVEQLKTHARFQATFCLSLVNDPCFYSSTGRGNKGLDCDNGVYRYFRNSETIKAEIPPPINHKNRSATSLCLQGEYSVEWKCLEGNEFIRYYLLEANVD